MVHFRFNRDLLPMKAHFFFFNAGTAPLVPYLPTYAKQLGFTAYIVGIIYTFLPIFGLLAKPLFGAIADRFQKHKFIFILFQVLTVAAFSGLYFIPEIPSEDTVDLSCGNGATFFHACAANSTAPNNCSVKFISEATPESPIAKCKMNCPMTSDFMWQTVCEHWKIPNYCYDRKVKLNFTSTIPKKSLRMENDCVLFPINKVKMIDDLEYSPKCPHTASTFTLCSSFCADHRVSELLDKYHSGVNYNTNMTCASNETYLSTCDIPPTELNEFVKSFENEIGDITCTVICHIRNALDYSNICDGWGMDDSKVCMPENVDLPPSLSFTGFVPLDKTDQENDCVYFKLQKIITDEGSIHYPSCPRVGNVSHTHFKSACQITCDDSNINNIILSTNQIKNNDVKKGNHQLWTFFTFMAMNWIGMAVVVSIADAICFEILGDRGEDYGRQRLWGSAGWGIFSLLTGLLIDKFSGNAESKDYSIAFILMFVFMVFDILVSFRLKSKQKDMSINIFKNVGLLFSSWQTFHFFIWTILCGMCTGLLWQFLFWHLEVLASTDCEQMNWIKTLQGLVSGIQTFGGEIPFFFLSGWILRKLGHLNSMTLVLAGFGVRFILYSLLSDPWWTLPIELFQGITFGMLYSTMASYASVISPIGIEATVMGLVGAVFEGIGTSLGSFVGGLLVEGVGGAVTFRLFGCAALAASIVNGFLVYFNRVGKISNEEYSTIIHYGGRNEAVDIVDDNDRIVMGRN